MNQVSNKQLKANRKNAKLGGVKTPEGKAVSKYNAMKHGILSKEVTLPGEEDALLIDMGKTLRKELAPQSEIEHILVDRIIANSWRLKRVLRIEREMMENDRTSESWNGEKRIKTLGEALHYNFVNKDTYGKLIRYETSIERGIYKALHELQRIQSARNGESPTVPMAIDIDISEDH